MTYPILLIILINKYLGNHESLLLCRFHFTKAEIHKFKISWKIKSDMNVFLGFLFIF